ncbi:MAG: MBL fold metallo-hydrolase [Gemmatimonadetes bacterium]|nr:MBL fold metallo-hydrolase [Gemmatimonadota bacterium]
MPEVGSGAVKVQGFTAGAFGENCYLVTCTASGRGILVDPGAATPQLLQAVKEQGVAVDLIVLTHAHIDHVEGVAEAKRATDAPVLLHRDDEQLYHATPLQAEWFGVKVEPPPPVDAYLAHGDVVRVGDCELAVRHAPGHASGHVLLVGEEVALVGDVVFRGSIGRTDLPGGDFQTLMRSIREQVLTLPDEMTLYTGHGPETTVGYERLTNPFLAQGAAGSAFG